MEIVDAKETAKAIRKELKEKYPKTKFSVRSHYFSMGSSVLIRWTDGVALDKVEKTVSPYARIDRDRMSGEILTGRNMFVNAHRDISPEIRERIRQDVRSRYGLDEEDYEFRIQCWQMEHSTDFY